jgi:hypothetical protein
VCVWVQLLRTCSPPNTRSRFDTEHLGARAKSHRSATQRLYAGTRVGWHGCHEAGFCARAMVLADPDTTTWLHTGQLLGKVQTMLFQHGLGETFPFLLPSPPGQGWGKGEKREPGGTSPGNSQTVLDPSRPLLCPPPLAFIFFTKKVLASEARQA